MTKITFDYTDSYKKPSRGSLAFAAHRRHASNETEVLPKPFMVPLVQGKAEVDLEPNSESWVWMVTENFAGDGGGGTLRTVFITVPEKDDSIAFNGMVKINPSTLPAPYDAVEPAWWAEVREYKSIAQETLTEAEKALDTAETSLSEGEQYRDESRQSAATSKAYANESRESAYESKDYRDTAEEWKIAAEEAADRAANGPESAQAKAEEARDDALKYRDAAKDYRDDAQSSANDARDDAQTANSHASDAYNSARDADTAKETAQGYRDEAKEARDDLLAEPDQLMNAAQDAKDTTASYRDEAKSARDSAQEYRDSAGNRADEAKTYRDETQSLYDDFSGGFSEWKTPTFRNEVADHDSYPIRYRITPFGVQFDGAIRVDGVEDDFTSYILEFEVPDGLTVVNGVFTPSAAYPYNSTKPVLRATGNKMSVVWSGDLNETSSLYFRGIMLPLVVDDDSSEE